ncbi:carbohydrate kinase [Polymorphospora sp. NPDC050346]|uniref:carbohydrate kinase family protein n=1 Tax=Polymorphospora sp. NPDC050346 TaxID=3155780 RepID=UPI0033CB2D18
MILVVGESLVDVIRRGDGTRDERAGGSPFNVAVGLTRLGRPTMLATRVGEDERGRRLVSHLRDEGVHLLGDPTGLPRTSSAVADLDDQGAARYFFDLTWDLPSAALPARATFLHTGSLATMIEPGAQTVLELMQRSRPKVTISYDPNIRPSLIADRKHAVAHVERSVAHAHLIKASSDDVEYLYPGEPTDAIAHRWLGLGPTVVVITSGAGGASLYTRHHTRHVAAPAVAVVDTVGAGDAFMAGLIDALARADLLQPQAFSFINTRTAETLDNLLRHATRVASLTCQRAGANPPTRQELDWASQHETA